MWGFMSCAFSIFKDKGSFWGCTCEISSFLCFFQQLWRIMSLRISQAGSGSQAKTKRTEEKAPSVSSPSPLASVVDSDGENSDSEVKKKKKKKKLRVHADSRASTPPTTRTPIETYTQASSKALSLPHFPSSASTRSSPVEDYFDEFANGGWFPFFLFPFSLSLFFFPFIYLNTTLNHRPCCCSFVWPLSSFIPCGLCRWRGFFIFSCFCFHCLLDFMFCFSG